jgi:pimeloyl-ACP methyl ester carboxylesterase
MPAHEIAGDHRSKEPSMSEPRNRRPSGRRLSLLLAACALLALIPVTAPSPASAATKPTIVLVHGAFADGSSWTAEVQQLQAHGYTVDVPANPLRGVSYDSAYLRSVLSSIKGPIVLVGHSYGGAVITNAATGNPNVKALVYVSAYAPDVGETLLGLGEKVPGGLVGPKTLALAGFPGPDGQPGTEATIKPSLFPEIAAADLPKPLADALAAEQRPAALGAFGEPSGEPAWKTIPSWAIFGTKDKTIGTPLLRFMAKRAKAKTTLVDGASHLMLASHPEAVTKVILAAAHG